MAQLAVHTKKGVSQELTPDLVLALYMLCEKLRLDPKEIDFQVTEEQRETHVLKIDMADSPSMNNGPGKPSLTRQVWEHLGTPVEYDALIQEFTKEDKVMENLMARIIEKKLRDALDYLFVYLDALKETQNEVSAELKDQNAEYEKDFKSAGGEIETLTLDDGREFKIAHYTSKFHAQTRAWLFVRSGVHYLVYKSGPNMGVLRNKDQQRCPCPSLLDLDVFVQNAVSEEEFLGAGSEPGWFFFEDLAGRGTETRPVTTPSQLSLDNFLTLLEEFIIDVGKE